MLYKIDINQSINSLFQDKLIYEIDRTGETDTINTIHVDYTENYQKRTYTQIIKSASTVQQYCSENTVLGYQTYQYVNLILVFISYLMCQWRHIPVLMPLFWRNYIALYLSPSPSSTSPQQFCLFVAITMVSRAVACS